MENWAEGVDGDGFLQIDGDGAGPWLAPPCAIDVDDAVRRKFLRMAFFALAGDADRLVEGDVDAVDMEQRQLRACAENERLHVAQRDDFFHRLTGGGGCHTAVVGIRRADDFDGGC